MLQERLAASEQTSNFAQKPNQFGQCVGSMFTQGSPPADNNHLPLKFIRRALRLSFLPSRFGGGRWTARRSFGRGAKPAGFSGWPTWPLRSSPGLAVAILGRGLSHLKSATRIEGTSTCTDFASGGNLIKVKMFQKEFQRTTQRRQLIVTRGWVGLRSEREQQIPTEDVFTILVLLQHFARQNA